MWVDIHQCSFSFKIWVAYLSITFQLSPGCTILERSWSGNRPALVSSLHWTDARCYHRSNGFHLRQVRAKTACNVLRLWNVFEHDGTSRMFHLSVEWYRIQLGTRLPSHFLHILLYFGISDTSLRYDCRDVSAEDSRLCRWADDLCRIFLQLHQHKSLSIACRDARQRIYFYILRNRLAAGHCLCLFFSARNKGKITSGNWKLFSWRDKIRYWYRMSKS